MIPIYRAERQDGIADCIARPENLAVSYASQIIPLGDERVNLIEAAKTKLLKLDEAIATNLNQVDLYYLYTILVSVGWNKNDDVFDPGEVWRARYTPEDKPFNLEHKPEKIIGHITGTYTVDDKYNIIAADTAVDELPDMFHLLTSSVIYKHIQSRNPDLKEEVAKLIDEIQSGDWYVSMECLFTDFSYAFMSSDGSQKIVPRNSDTAYLSKHLRAYGGAGEYENYKIGRLLRNIAFSGKGLVRKPANPKSVIFTDTEKFNGIFSSLATFGVTNNNQAFNLEVAEMEEKRIAELEAQLAEAKQQLQNVNETALREEIDALKADVAKANTQIAELTAQAEKAKAEKAEVDKVLAEAQANAKTLESDLTALRAENLKTQRITTLVDKGVDKAEAETIVAKFATLADEQFEQIVEMQTKLVEAAKAKPDEDDDEEEDEAEANAKPEELVTVKPEETPEMNATAGDEKSELMQALAEYFSEQLKKK